MNPSYLIKNKAYELGFSKVGIAQAKFYEAEEYNLNQWLDNGFHGTMQWIEKRKEEKSNLFKYYPNSKSVISVAINYFTGRSTDYFQDYKISNYAWGEDYHLLVKTKLYQLLDFIKK